MTTDNNSHEIFKTSRSEYILDIDILVKNSFQFSSEREKKCFFRTSYFRWPEKLGQDAIADYSPERALVQTWNSLAKFEMKDC